MRLVLDDIIAVLFVLFFSHTVIHNIPKDPMKNTTDAPSLSPRKLPTDDPTEVRLVLDDITINSTTCSILFLVYYGS